MDRFVKLNVFGLENSIMLHMKWTFWEDVLIINWKEYIVWDGIAWWCRLGRFNEFHDVKWLPWVVKLRPISELVFLHRSDLMEGFYRIFCAPVSWEFLQTFNIIQHCDHCPSNGCRWAGNSVQRKKSTFFCLYVHIEMILSFHQWLHINHICLVNQTYRNSSEHSSINILIKQLIWITNSTTYSNHTNHLTQPTISNFCSKRN